MAESEITARPKVRKEDGDAAAFEPQQHPGGKYDHPVYKKLAIMNGEVNKLTKDEIKNRLEDLNLDTRGVKEVLKKRLKNHYKRLKLTRANMTKPSDKQPHYDYYMVIDFEATCEEYNLNYKHEIIEFPIVLVDAKERAVVEEFHSYVRPVINAKLTSFCTSLTGISQSKVEESPKFPEVLRDVTDWMTARQLGTEKTFAVVTDGPWDMARFMYQQCQHSSLPFPNWARKWLNLRKAYRNFYRCKKNSLKLSEMLLSLGMTFEGHQHSGIDDSRNIARVLIHMLTDGASMKINEELYSYKIRNNPDAGTAEMKVGPIHTETSSDSEHTDDAECSENCKKATVTINDEISVKLKDLSIRDMAAPPSECSETEQYDDLLAYYALQKA